jgi:hypothetical protein
MKQKLPVALRPDKYHDILSDGFRTKVAISHTVLPVSSALMI